MVILQDSGYFSNHQGKWIDICFTMWLIHPFPAHHHELCMDESSPWMYGNRSHYQNSGPLQELWVIISHLAKNVVCICTSKVCWMPWWQFCQIDSLMEAAGFPGMECNEMLPVYSKKSIQICWNWKIKPIIIMHTLWNRWVVLLRHKWQGFV